MGGIVDLGGEREAIQWAKKLANGMKRDIVKAMDKAEVKMPARARSTHKFTSRTGAVDRSIQAEVDVVGNIATFTFFAEPVLMKSGYNRTWLLNDGTRGNYRRGTISPTAVTVGGKSGTGIKHDDFMGNAWAFESVVLMKAINRIMDRMR